MDETRIIPWTSNQAHTDRLRVVLWWLWLLCAAAAILITFGTIAYALDDRAVLSNQKQGLIVKNWKGQYIGTSHHVVSDSSTGNILFIIVSLYNEENKEIAIPIGLFSIGKGNGVLVLSVSKEKLESLPVYHASDLKDPEFAKKVYRFFAIMPPWTEESPEGENEHLLRF